MAAAFLTAGVFADERPKQVVLNEILTANKHLQSDPEIEKIRKRMQYAFIKRLKELGISEGIAKRSVLMRARKAAGEQDRRGKRRRGDLKAPKNPLTPGWSVQAERKLKRKGKKND